MARRPFQQRDPWPLGHLFEKQVGLELPLMEDGGNNFFGARLVLCAMASDPLVSSGEVSFHLLKVRGL
jgi:hypothetical protein